MSDLSQSSQAAVNPVRPSLWRHADFLKLWAGQTISVFGSQFTFLALPIIGAVVLGASPAQMGLLSALETVPFLLVGLFAGVWVDRNRRRPLMIAADIGRALVLASIPAAYLLGELSLNQLFVVAFVYGLLTVFFDVSYQSYLPSLVGREHLVEGNSKLTVSESTAQIAGPSLAGLVVQALSAPLAIVVDAVSFLLSALCLTSIRKPEAKPEKTGRPMLAEVREGLGVVFGSRELRSIAGCTGTGNFFSQWIMALYVLFATRDLGLDAAAIGLVWSVGSFTALGGALLAGPAAARLGVGRAIVLGSVGFAAANLPIALAAPGLAAIPFLVLGQALGSLGNPVYNINQVSLRQAITPGRLLGRMNATMRFLVWGTMPLGALVGGGLGEVLGLRTAIAIGAVGGLLAILWVFFSPVRGLVRIPEPAADAS